MPTRNIVLTQHHETVIKRLVSSGRYQNASEVLREGLRLVERSEHLEAAKLEALRELSRTGFADLDQGRFTDIGDADLEDVIGLLGREAGLRAPAASKP